MLAVVAQWHVGLGGLQHVGYFLFIPAAWVIGNKLLMYAGVLPDDWVSHDMQRAWGGTGCSFMHVQRSDAAARRHVQQRLLTRSTVTSSYWRLGSLTQCGVAGFYCSSS